MGRTLPEQVLTMGSDALDRTCMVDGSERYTYRQFRDQSFAVRETVQRDVTPGDRVGLLLDSSFGYAAGCYGVWAARGVVVGLNAGLKAPNLERFLRHSEAKALLADPEHPEFGAETSALGDDVRVVHLRQTGLSSAPPSTLGEVDVIWPEEGDLASIVYTSGTTGHPKGVMLTHANLRANTESICQYLDVRPSDRALCVLPFYYSYGASVLNSHLLAGARVVVERSLMFPHLVLEQMVREGITSFAGVPSTFYLLLKRTSLSDFDLRNLRYCTQAGGGMDPARIAEFRESVPATNFIVMYGQTEASARLAWLPPERLDKKPGSAGRAIPGVELVIKGPGEETLPAGELGEVCARGENVMQGYWKEPGETRKVLKDGWLHTGDVGTMDEEGFLFLKGRSREMIKSGAHRIAPAEIEEVIREVEGVRDVAVAGIEDEILGQAIKAFVIPENGDQDLKRMIQRACRQRLPLFKVPKEVEFRSSFPRTSSGKIRKHLLAESEEGPGSATDAR